MTYYEVTVNYKHYPDKRNATIDYALGSWNVDRIVVTNNEETTIVCSSMLGATRVIETLTANIGFPLDFIKIIPRVKKDIERITLITDLYNFKTQNKNVYGDIAFELLKRYIGD